MLLPLPTDRILYKARFGSLQFISRDSISFRKPSEIFIAFELDFLLALDLLFIQKIVYKIFYLVANKKID